MPTLRERRDELFVKTFFKDVPDQAVFRFPGSGIDDTYVKVGRGLQAVCYHDTRWIGLGCSVGIPTDTTEVIVIEHSFIGLSFQLLIDLFTPKVAIRNLHQQSTFRFPGHAKDEVHILLGDSIVCVDTQTRNNGGRPGWTGKGKAKPSPSPSTKVILV